MNETLNKVTEEVKVKEETVDDASSNLQEEGPTNEEETPLYDVLFEEKLVTPVTLAAPENIEEKLYYCCKCSFTTNTRNNMKEHLTKHLSSDKRYFCLYCNYSSYSEEALNSHILYIHTKDMKSESIEVKPEFYLDNDDDDDNDDKNNDNFNNENKETWYCSQCSFQTKSRIYLRLHINDKHSDGTKPFNCSACEYCTYYKHDLKKHVIRKHGLEEYRKVEALLVGIDTSRFKRQCPRCSYSTIYKYELKRHLLSKHGEILEPPIDTSKPKHNCLYCQYSTIHKGDLKKHVIRMHIKNGIIQPPNKPRLNNRCKNCSYSAPSKYDLKKHIILKHGIIQQNNNNNNIDEIINNKRKQLINEKLNNIKKYTCNDCNYCTSSKKLLKIHFIDHRHNKDDKSTFICPECPFITTNLKYLKRHLRRHYSGRKYQCPYCKYSFFHNSALSSHILHKHTSVNDIVNMYCCNQCPFKTKNKYYLNTHIGAKHSLEIRYSCSKCDYTTFYKSSITTHMYHKHSICTAIIKCNQCSFTTRHEKTLRNHKLAKH